MVIALKVLFWLLMASAVVLVTVLKFPVFALVPLSASLGVAMLISVRIAQDGERRLSGPRQGS